MTAVGERETQVAVITGASSGVGRLLTEQLVARNWEVVPVSRGSDGRLDEVASAHGLDPVYCDMSQPDQIDDAAAEIRAKHPSINLLALFSGNTLRKRLLETTAEEMYEAFDINVVGPALLLQGLVEPLQTAAPSRVIFASSAASDLPNANSAFYSMAKGTVRHQAIVAQQELKPRGIGVSVLLPGNYDSPGHPYPYPDEARKEDDKPSIKSRVKDKISTTTQEAVAAAALQEALRTDAGYQEIRIPNGVAMRFLRMAARHRPALVAGLVDSARKPKP